MKMNLFMKQSLFFSIAAFLLAFFIFSATAAENKPKVNIIRHPGFGLKHDAEILAGELKNLGYSVRTYKLKAPSVRQADINVFFQETHQDFIPFAKKNYFIPNPEWFLEEISVLAKFDMILCKTREGKRIFKQYHPNTVYMGFTSPDRCQLAVKKNYRLALHLAGFSLQKGTDSIIKAWETGPQLPGLTIYRHRGRCDYPPLVNMQLFCYFVPDDKLIKIQNSYGLHLCTSETEGFGHYISEAFSCTAIVITTDAPPMNEFVTDKRCLVAYTHTSEQNLATNYYVDPIHLRQVVANLMQLSDTELAEIGKKNRQFYLKQKLRFQKKIRQIFAVDQTPVLLKNELSNGTSNDSDDNPIHLYR